MRQSIFLLSIILLPAVTIKAQNANTPAQGAPPNAGTISVFPDFTNYVNTANRNFVRTYAPSKPTENAQAINMTTNGQLAIPCVIKTQYLDGLGRPLQEVFRSGNNNADVVTPHAYDLSGRESHSYLTYTVNAYGTPNDGRLKTSPVTQLSAQYNQLFPGQHPYGKTEYEPSPLGRVTGVYAPGYNWIGMGRKASAYYSCNQAGLNDRIINWKVDFLPSSAPVSAGYYPDGELFKYVSTDEDNRSVSEYKDKQGRLICRRHKYVANLTAPGTGDYAETHYVYDDLGHLRWVLTPEAISNANNGTASWLIDNDALDGLCYRYVYDQRGRMIEKQLPGKAVEYMVYDRRDRLVLYQDGQLSVMYRGAVPPSHWQFFTYDALDRPTSTGLYSTSSSRSALADMMNAATGNYAVNDILYYLYNTGLYNTYVNNPTNGEVLTYTYYDDYNNPAAGTYNSSFASMLIGEAGFVIPTILSNHTRGLATAGKVKVMDGNNTFLSSTNFYDDRGNMIQSSANNLQGGQDIVTLQYDFRGDVLSSVSDHTNPLCTTPSRQHVTGIRRYVKDQYSGQIKRAQLNLGDGLRDIYANSFDDMGRVANKKLGGGINQVFKYNVRGWLTGINEANIANGNTPDFFHERISYDHGFDIPSYNGNISGIIWRGAGQLSRKRYYGYTYDQLNRLTGASFGEQAPTTLHNIWSRNTNDYTVSNITYDFNGNLKTMDQRGPGLTGPVDMDKLSYHYRPKTNLLEQVTDNTVGTATIAPDFKDGNGGTDYDYDLNGNLTIDKNKGINSDIKYSYLNKPEEIVVDQKGTIAYLYDATGNKLRKTITSSSGTVTTDYSNGFVYEDNKLEYVLHEEGRSRPNPSISGGWLQDYFIKDHLGNVRSVVNVKETTELPVFYQAGLEIAHANTEGLVWSHLDEVRENSPDAGPGDVMAAMLNGEDPERRIGTAIMLRVMPGDKFKIDGDSWYEDVSNESPVSGADLAASLVGALSNGNLYGGTPVAELGENVDLITQAFGTENFIGAYDELMAENYDPGKPAAFLNYVVFDENLQVQNGSKAIQVTGDHSTWVANSSNGYIEIGQPGYIAVWTANRGIGPVYYDRLKITYYKGSVLEEDHYYPFGLTLSSASANISERNNYKLATKELQQDFDLNWYDFINRPYDMQIGRFTTFDPLAEISRRWTPYNYCLNNPVRYIDPDGMTAGDFIDRDGKKIGSDGKADGKVYVMKTGETTFGNKADGEDVVPAAGLKESDYNATLKFIKKNNGNTPAFEGNSIAYDNSVEIEGKESTRQAMVNEMNKDDGSGGTAPNSNTEFSVLVDPAGSVKVLPAIGPVDPSIVMHPTGAEFIDDESVKSSAHSHGSGSKKVVTKGTTNNSKADPRNGNNVYSSSSDKVTVYSWQQHPSEKDINTAGNKIRYMFGMGSQKVHIYNGTGVQATIPLSRFVKPK